MTNLEKRVEAERHICAMCLKIKTRKAGLIAKSNWGFIYVCKPCFWKDVKRQAKERLEKTKAPKPQKQPTKKRVKKKANRP